MKNALAKKLGDNGRKFLGQRGKEVHLLPRFWMGEMQFPCVQALTNDIFLVSRSKFCIGTAVKLIPQKRMSNRRHVYADLVGSSGFQFATNE